MDEGKAAEDEPAKVVVIRYVGAESSVRSKVEVPASWLGRGTAAEVVRAFGNAAKVASSRLQLRQDGEDVPLSTPVDAMWGEYDAVEVGKFRVCLSGSLYEGLGYVGGKGFPPPTAKHGMVFLGRRDGASRIEVIECPEGKYAGLHLPTHLDGERVLEEAAGDLPLRASEPRSPPGAKRALAPEVQAAWDHFFKHGIPQDHDHYPPPRDNDGYSDDDKE